MRKLMTVNVFCAIAMVAGATACGPDGAAEFNLKEEIDGGTSATDGGSSIADAGGTVATTPDEKWCYRDADGDTFGDLLTKVEAPVGTACPVGHLERDGDCNDADPSVNPGQPESTGNGKDDDCNTFTLDGSPPPQGSVTDAFRYTAPGGFVKSSRVVACADLGSCKRGLIGTVFTGGATGSNVFDFSSVVVRGTGGGTRYYRVSVDIAPTASGEPNAWSCIGSSTINGDFADKSSGAALTNKSTTPNGIGGCEVILKFEDR